MLRAALDHALDRIAERELDGIRTAELLGERPRFAEIFEHYRATRFLYSSKLEELGPRLQAIEATWSRLIAADGTIFKMLLRYVVEGGRLAPGTSICAFEFAPECWLVQHLVSARRHEFTGTLAACIGITDFASRATPAGAMRFSYRDSNPGVASLFGGFLATVRPEKIELRRAAYALLDARRADLRSATPPAGVRIAEVDAALAPRVLDFYLRRGHGAGVLALHLEEPRAAELRERYQRQGLDRSRRVFAALRDERVVGAAIAHESSLGMNFSFLENSVEMVELDPELGEVPAREALVALVASALRARQATGPEPVALLVDREHAALGRSAGLLGEAAKEYAVMTILLADGGAAGIRAGILNHYRDLFTRLGAADGRAQ